MLSILPATCHNGLHLPYHLPQTFSRGKRTRIGHHRSTHSPYPASLRTRLCYRHSNKIQYRTHRNTPLYLGPRSRNLIALPRAQPSPRYRHLHLPHLVRPVPLLMKVQCILHPGAQHITELKNATGRISVRILLHWSRLCKAITREGLEVAGPASTVKGNMLLRRWQF